MSAILPKKSIVKKTMEVGGATLVSRIFGIIRELLFVGYLGVGLESDAFLAAFRIPNSLRKIFAEGSLSGTFIPTFIYTFRKEGLSAANKLMSLSFIFFEGFILLLCVLAIFNAKAAILFAAPGFSEVQIAYAIPLLQLLIPFILLISSSALLAGALQSVNHFFTPSITPVIFNIIFIIGLIVCTIKSLPVNYLCYAILLGGAIKLILHIITYIKLNFSFELPDKKTFKTFSGIFFKFIPSCISMSITEISAFIDCQFSSFLPAGSLSLISYAHRFMGIPLGVFGVAFSKILLPHFSRLGTYAPKRLAFYLLESSKLIFWILLPTSLLMGFFSCQFFTTIFVPTGKFSLSQADTAGSILVAYLMSLSFIALNKIILNIYFALHNTRIPFVIALSTAALNFIANMILIGPFKITGLAYATSLTACVQTILLLTGLHFFFSLKLYIKQFSLFLYRYIVQLVCVLFPFLLLYYGLEALFLLAPAPLPYCALSTFGLWLWVGPLCCSILFVLFFSRKYFKIQLYFVD